MKKCGWCGEAGTNLSFVAEVGQWYHDGTCLDNAYNEGNDKVAILDVQELVWYKVSTLSPTKKDMPCVVALGYGRYDIATNRAGSDWWLNNAYYDGDEAPTFWMPLPDLPKD